jgi:hypothetical protein
MSIPQTSRQLLIYFLENHVQTWMECATARSKSQGHHRSLVDHIYKVGVDALFCLDNLRRIRDPSFSVTVFGRLEDVTSISPSLSLGALPHIFSSYIHCSRQYRSALYSQASHRDAAPIDGLRADGMLFFVMCNSLVDKFASAEEAWSTRHALLAVVEDEDLFSVFQRDAEGSLSLVGHSAIDALHDINNRTQIILILSK